MSCALHSGKRLGFSGESATEDQKCMLAKMKPYLGSRTFWVFGLSLIVLFAVGVELLRGLGQIVKDGIRRAPHALCKPFQIGGIRNQSWTSQCVAARV